MFSALYYPFTRPENVTFLKTSLFLWDTVDFIVPFPDFKPYIEDKKEEEALDLIGRSYVPTNADKLNAHEEFKKLCESEYPERFVFDLENPSSALDFYPEKLLPETWRLLADSKLAKVVESGDEVQRASTNALFGYYMMSVLAVCCSSDRKRLVTDNHDPYRTLANIMVDETKSDTSKDDWHGRLISISLAGPNFKDVTLENLVNLRAGEDQLLQQMRRVFTKSVDETAANIAANIGNINVVTELISQFSDNTEKDLRDLKRALRVSAAQTILNKNTAISVATYTAGLVAAPFTGGLSSVGAAIATAGGLTSELIAYRDRRRKILKEHPTSWLMAAAGPKMPLT